MDLGLQGKVAIVTGGGQGIGRATCLQLARESASVVVADLDLGGAQEVCREIRELGGRALPCAVDVGSGPSVREMVEAAGAAFAGVDILVNAAGIISIADVADLAEADWDRVFQVNAKGVFLACQAVLRQMIDRRVGKIVNIASQAGKTGFPHEAHYSASKGAVIAFTQALAREVARYSVNVNAVCPGSIETGMNDIVTRDTARLLGISAEEKRRQTITATPLARKGTPEDVADLITFLVSRRAGFMTGQAVNITGGRELH